MEALYLPYVNAIHQQKNEMIETLIGWCGQNSFSDNVSGLDATHKLLANNLQSLKGKAASLPLPPRKVIDAGGHAIYIPQGAALQIKKRPEAKRQILLAGHMDTVFPPSHPFQAAIRRENRLNGPGAADMKGGLLILWKALEALESSPWSQNIGWEVLITPDEETGSCGSLPLYEKAAQTHHLGLLFEPSFPDGALVSSRKGSSNLVVVARGTAAHAGRDFFSGRNAVTALARLALEIEQLSDSQRGITANVGEISGGKAFNIVPDFALAKINLRTLSKEDDDMVKDCMTLLVQDIARQYEVIIETHELVTRPPKSIGDGTQKLFDLFSESGKDLGIEIAWRPSGGVCDGNIVASLGLPTIDSLGAIGGGLHTSDEYIELESLGERASLTALFLLKTARESETLGPHETFFKDREALKKRQSF